MEVLLVEDDDNDIEAFARLVARSSLNVRVTTATTADGAIENLAGRRTELETGGGRAPDLVLLDLSLPAKPGMDVLRWLKGDDQLRDIPMVIVSGSRDDRAIQQGRALGAHSHISKPITLESLVWIVTAVRNYRSRLAKLPSTS